MKATSFDEVQQAYGDFEKQNDQFATDEDQSLDSEVLSPNSVVIQWSYYQVLGKES